MAWVELVDAETESQPSNPCRRQRWRTFEAVITLSLALMSASGVINGTSAGGRTKSVHFPAGSIGQRNTLIFQQRWSVDMKQRRRIYYSAAQRSEIWDRWQAGEPMSSIGRRFDRESSSVFSVISPTGGIRPADRHRAKQVLSLSEREEISRWLSMRCSLRSIARHLGRSPSTISREVQRNGGADRYRAARSDQAAWDRARRPKLCKLACRPFLRRTVSTLLQRQWSPEQVAGCQAHISGGISKAGVTRDDLSQPVHSGARRAEKGAS